MSSKKIVQPTCDEVFSEGPLMTRICSQLTNSKLPLQGQKNVEVKEEKNDEKNLYRDISTSYFRKIQFRDFETSASSKE